MPQVPTANILKNVKFAAAYTSLTFNRKNDAFYRISGVLDGMQVSRVNPTDINVIENERKVRTNLICNAGFELIHAAKPSLFIFPGPAMECWQADNLTDKAAGSKVEIITDPAQTVRGGAAVKLTSQSYFDPGGVQPDLTTLPAAIRSNARIFQPIDGYKELVGEPLTLAVGLRLPPASLVQVHDLQISIYGSSLGTPGFSDTPVDKARLVIPAGSL